MKKEDPMDIVAAAESGDRLETLIALRDLLAQRLRDADSDRDISSMSRRLMQCMCEIDILKKQQTGKSKDPAEEFFKKYRTELDKIRKSYSAGNALNEREGY